MNKNKEYTTPLTGGYLSRIESVIKIKYRDNIKFNICKLTYELHDNGNYQYIFEPYYDVLDALPSSLSQGIPGLNLDKRKNVYYRVNILPAFIKERTMGEDREDLKEELDKVYMKENNPLEWLIRTDTEYSGDNLIVERYREPRKITQINYNDLMYGDVLNNLDDLAKDVEERGNQLLSLIGGGVIIEAEDLQINQSSRMGALQLLINQYDKALKYSKEHSNKHEKPHPVAKKPKIDDFVMEEIIKELELKIISEKEAMDLMEVNSTSTLYRRIREYNQRKVTKHNK